MLNKLRKVKLGSKGFTLVELLVVIAILGILAAIVIPRLTGQSDAAKVARVKSDLRTMDEAVQIYATQKSNQATTIASLTAANLIAAEPVAPTTFTAYSLNAPTTSVAAFTAGSYIMSAKANASRPVFQGNGSGGYFIEDISQWN